MTRETFRKLNKKGFLPFQRFIYSCALPSATDPTQDCPVSRVYQAMVEGHPLSLPEQKNVYNGLKVDQLSEIEKRNFDQFDAFARLRKDSKAIQKGVATIDKLTKKSTQNEI